MFDHCWATVYDADPTLIYILLCDESWEDKWSRALSFSHKLSRFKRTFTYFYIYCLLSILYTTSLVKGNTQLQYLVISTKITVFYCKILFSLFIPRPWSRGGGYCHHHVWPCGRAAVRPCVRVSFPDDISEIVSRIAFILHTHIP